MSVSPPRPHGPHLNALRAFESAARLGSFVAAADELGVTPGAIAQHIKSLEAWSEADLFIRSARGVTLTPLGEELSPEFSNAFVHLNNAVQSLRTKAAPNKLRIATLPAIAQMWLSERLGKLRLVEPDISVSVYAIEKAPDLQRDPFDISLFFEDGPTDDGDFVVFEDCIFPVCTPEIAQRLTKISDLHGETLLHDATWGDDWEIWLKSASEPEKIISNGPRYSLFSVAVEEARNGAGILIAHEMLISKLLKNGELVAPFKHRLILPRKLVMKFTPCILQKYSTALLKSIIAEK
jgi:LysR family glycine cleavage system transcriptional activator